MLCLGLGAMPVGVLSVFQVCRNKSQARAPAIDTDADDCNETIGPMHDCLAAVRDALPDELRSEYDAATDGVYAATGCQ
jgi:hypothetical protein